MSKLLLPLLSVVLTLWLICGSWWYVSRHTSGKGQSYSAEFYIPSFSLNIGDFEAYSGEIFSFKEKTAELFVPDQMRVAFEKIGQYLQQNPERKLVLEGICSADEVRETGQQDLGRKRALSVKRHFIALGVDTEQITAKNKTVYNAQFANSYLYGGINFIFEEQAADIEDYSLNDHSDEEVDSKIERLQALNLKYRSANTVLKMSPPLATYFDRLQGYLYAQPDAVVHVTGHTDSQGSRAFNMSLSKQRAAQVKAFMIDHGFPSERIIAFHKGPDEPIASNETEAGRLKNRRVEIRVYNDRMSE